MNITLTFEQRQQLIEIISAYAPNRGYSKKCPHDYCENTLSGDVLMDLLEILEGVR
jgi:hypothetical protein